MSFPRLPEKTPRGIDPEVYCVIVDHALNDYPRFLLERGEDPIASWDKLVKRNKETAQSWKDWHDTNTSNTDRKLMNTYRR